MSRSGTFPITLLQIRHRTGSYDVKFVQAKELPGAFGPRTFVITDNNVRKAWGALIPAEVPVLSVDPGEASKSLSTYERCLTWLLDSGADRNATVVALGGGVVGDLAGFVAATYMRGIAHKQIPTSLLAQVDSSVGGKVAVDLPGGKNLVGAFHPPVEVLVSIETLQTLPEREFINGLAEVWKYGFIMDTALLQRLDAEPAAQTHSGLEEIVRRCIELKAEVVSEDEFDLTGRRAILNFGHTIGHALETLSGYAGILHGEAIAIGMVAEASLGERLGITEAGVAGEVERRLAGSGLPVNSPALHDDRLLMLLKGDKKAENGELSFSLLTRIGECKLVRNVPRKEVEAALRSL